MFDYLKVEGFRSLSHVELSAAGLSVLIGSNGSGKSNLLDFISLMSEAAQGRLEDGIAARGGFDDTAFKGGLGEIFVELHFPPKGWFAQEKATVSFKLKLKRMGSGYRVWYEQVSKAPGGGVPLHLMHRDRDGCMFRSVKTGMREALAEEGKRLESETELAIFQVRDPDNYPTPHKILRVVQDWTLYREMDVGCDSPIRRPGLLRPATRLAPDGGNLASVLFSIQQQHPAVWREILELLATVYPDFESITFPPEGGDGKVVIRWWEQPFGGGFSANLLSDGTLKLLCLIAILKGPDPPPLIAIDEPELGLHPDWIKLVAELLDSASSRTQLIVTTHSPQLISRLSADQVVVAEKRVGETRLERLTDESLAKWLAEFSLGDLWLAGHFGGRP